MDGQCRQSRTKSHATLPESVNAAILGSGGAISQETGIEIDHENGVATGLGRGERTGRGRGNATAQETAGRIVRKITGAKKSRESDDAHDRLYPTDRASSALAPRLLRHLLHPNVVEGLDRLLHITVPKRLSHRRKFRFAASTTLPSHPPSMEAHRPRRRSPISKPQARLPKPQTESREPRSHSSTTSPPKPANPRHRNPGASSCSRAKMSSTPLKYGRRVVGY